MKILSTVTNSVTHDQRILKMAHVLHDMGHEVRIAGRRYPGTSFPAIPPFEIVRFRMLFRKGFLFYACFQIRLFVYLLFARYDLLISNDLDTLLPGVLACRCRKKLQVYDAHEYFPGLPEVMSKPWVLRTWKRAEVYSMKRIRNMITVNESLAGLFDQEYGHRPLVVRNMSPRYQLRDARSRADAGIPAESFTVVLQGTGINTDRGGEELLEALAPLEEMHLMIIGSGDALPGMKKMVQEKGMFARVHFFPRMPYPQMMAYTALADVGVSLDKEIHLNYRFSLPNKIFDYLQAGIPFLATRLQEIQKIVERYECGRLISPSLEVEELRRELRLLHEQPEIHRTLCEKARLAAAELCWENEREKVEDFYKKILAVH